MTNEETHQCLCGACCGSVRQASLPSQHSHSRSTCGRSGDSIPRVPQQVLNQVAVKRTPKMDPQAETRGTPSSCHGTSGTSAGAREGDTPGISPAHQQISCHCVASSLKQSVGESRSPSSKKIALKLERLVRYHSSSIHSEA